MEKEFLLDVRTQEEFMEARVPNSVNIPLDELHYRKDEILKFGDNILVICASGARARVACDFLKKLGISNAKVMEGGISEYHRRGGNVVFGN